MDHNGQPHNPMVNSGAIMSAALLLYMVRPELSTSEKFEFVQNFLSRMLSKVSSFKQTEFFSSFK